MTSSIKWEPVEDLKAVRNLVDRTFARTFSAARGRLPIKFLKICPPADVTETDETYVVAMDLPGVQVDQLDVSVSGHKLTVKGERLAPPRQTGEEAQMVIKVQRERAMGKFSRTFEVPEGLDTDQISAGLQHGVLTLTLPKAAAPQEAKIEVGS